MKRTLLLIALVAASGCNSLPKNLNIVNPTYSLRNIQPRVAIALPLSASTIDFDFDLGIDNPNSVGLTLSGINFDLLVNGSHLLASETSQAVKIPASGYGAVHLRSRVGYNEIRGIFQQVADVVQGNRANYEVRGTAYYDTPVGRLNFPVTVYATR